jgi:peroxiredoxin
MKKIGIITVLVLGPLFLSSVRAQEGDSLQAIRLLQQWEERNRATPYLSYHSTYRQVNSAMEDSLFATEGTVWLSPLPSDSIFGYRFHVRGADRQGAFDYYYDGQKALEIRYRQREIKAIDPHLFPNDIHNPAKARTSLLAVQPLLQQKDLIRFLITDNPYAGKPGIRLQCTGTERIIILDYPANKYGSLSTDSLFLEGPTGLLVRTSLVNRWNGTIYKAVDEIEKITSGNPAIADSIALTSSYPDYHFEEVLPSGKHLTDPLLMTGKPAPGFSCPAFDGPMISLRQFKGKYILLDFWESWCGYCILALPEIKDLYKQYHPKGLEIIGITTENENKIAGLIRANGLPYISLKGDTTLLNRYHIEGRPGYVLIDPAGKIAAYNDWGKILKILSQMQ